MYMTIYYMTLHDFHWCALILLLMFHSSVGLPSGFIGKYSCFGRLLYRKLVWDLFLNLTPAYSRAKPWILSPLYSCWSKRVTAEWLTKCVQIEVDSHLLGPTHLPTQSICSLYCRVRHLSSRRTNGIGWVTEGSFVLTTNLLQEQTLKMEECAEWSACDALKAWLCQPQESHEQEKGDEV